MFVLRRAVLQEPASAYRWADLGEAYFEKKQLEQGKACFQRALLAGPRSPSVLTRAANFYFETGDYTNVLRCVSEILRDPYSTSYYPAAFLTYTRMGVPIAEVLQAGVPHQRWPAQSFLRFLMEGYDVPNARVTWQWLVKQDLIDDQVSGQYVDFLLRNQLSDEAAKTWRELYPPKTNWVFNGSFENALKPCVLDWKIDPSGDVQGQRMGGNAHSGAFSLQLEFAGKDNVDYHQLGQLVVVKPGKWNFSAAIKTEELSTDRGVQMRVYDVLNGTRLDVRTPALNGTNDWTTVELTFTVGPATKVVRVEVMRAPSMKFDNKIRGKAWIDSVELTPAG